MVEVPVLHLVQKHDHLLLIHCFLVERCYQLEEIEVTLELTQKHLFLRPKFHKTAIITHAKRFQISLTSCLEFNVSSIVRQQLAFYSVIGSVMATGQSKTTD